MILPTLEYEQKLWNSGIKYIAGVDEVGRGALAGPVVAAAVVFQQTHLPIAGIRDSKTLSKIQKGKLNTSICQQSFCHAIGEASAGEIDKFGIVTATALAMQRAVQNLVAVDHLLIDGKPLKCQQLDEYMKTFIIKGDALSYSIAAASIIAKVYRDKLMSHVATQYPLFNLENNAGYGSAQHMKAIKTYGPSNIHRKSFLTKFS